MERNRPKKQLIRTKKIRFTYRNVFLEAKLDDIEYVSNEELEDYYDAAEEISVAQGEIYCFIESEDHEPNFRLTARNDFNLLVHEDKKGNVSVLVPLDNGRHIVVPTDNFIAANNAQLKAHCNAVRGRMKEPTILIIKNK